MIYTIKDLAQELKIDKQRIYRYIKKEKIEALSVSNEALQKWCEVHHEVLQKNTKFYSEEVKKQIFSHFSNKNEENETLGVSSEAPHETLGVSSETPHEAPHEAPYNAEMIDILKAQIRSLEKDKENLQIVINNQQKTLEQTQILLSQEQLISMSLQKKIPLLEQSNSNATQEINRLNDELKEEKNKSFLKRLFGK